MSKQRKSLEELDREYRRRRLAVREEAGLSWEKRELKLKALSDEHYKRRKEMEAA